MQHEINELRNQVRILKRMLFGVFGVFGLVFVGGLLAATTLQSVPDVIQAKKFEVVNGDGQAVVLLTANNAGGFVDIQNGKGQNLVQLTAHSEGGTISTHNSHGKILILMGGNEHGSGALQTRNNKGKTLVTLGTDLAGEGIVFTENGKGEKTSEMP
ncbi:MAG: hypothetical protein P8M22_03250 [Phycisphaerales bacterium]|nr:hypothetical protein [Phycisphaerales bacterium]